MNIKFVQSRLLEMGKNIAKTLEKHNIPYMITFGTLLGAVRHKGFIPWDDDFDFFLFDETYEDALNVLRHELPKDMFVEYYDTEPLYFHNWAHIKDLNTITNCKQFPQDNLYKHKGLSIDLYKAVEIEKGELEHYLFKEHIHYLERRYKIGSLSSKEYANKRERVESEFFTQKKDTSNSAKKILAMSLAEQSMPIEDVFPLKKYSFCDTEFYGPFEADHILSHFYGDYMALPPEEKRTPHYDSVTFIK